MTIQEQINILESKQLELRAEMQSKDYINNKISDAYYLHGEEAAQNVVKTYREALEAREVQRAEYNANEVAIKKLYEELKKEQEQTPMED